MYRIQEINISITKVNSEVVMSEYLRVVHKSSGKTQLVKMDKYVIHPDDVVDLLDNEFESISSIHEELVRRSSHESS